MSDREFDNYLTLLARLLRLDNRQRERIASELRAHLEDRLDELLAGGMSRDEAVQVALAEFGDAAGLAAEFGSLSRNRKRRWLMRVTTFSAAAIFLLAAGLAIFWPGRNAGPGVAAVVAQDPQPEKPAADPATPDRPNQPVEADLSARLNKRIDAEFIDTPLKDALQILSDSSGIQFYVKQKKLEDSGLNLDVGVTKNLKQVRLSTLLDLMFEELGLTYYEKDDLIVITTGEDAGSTLEVRVYDCRDLLGLPLPGEPMGMPPPGTVPGPGVPSGLVPGLPMPGTGLPPGIPSSIGPPRTDSAVPGTPAPIRGGGGLPRSPAALPKEIMPQFGGGVPGMGGGMGGMGTGEAPPRTEHEKHAAALINLITTNVAPESWNDVGGPGSVSEYHGLIVVTQTAHIHKKVERVLDMLREAAGLEVGGTKKVVR